jgi:hypothetical protein
MPLRAACAGGHIPLDDGVNAEPGRGGKKKKGRGDSKKNGNGDKKKKDDEEEDDDEEEEEDEDHDDDEEEEEATPRKSKKKEQKYSEYAYTSKLDKLVSELKHVRDNDPSGKSKPRARPW